MTKNEIAAKKRQAVHLFIVKGYEQKKIAQILCLSEKTISKWKIMYNWKENTDIKIKGGLSAFMERFFNYVKSVKPDEVNSFKTLWYNFLKKQEK